MTRGPEPRNPEPGAHAPTDIARFLACNGFWVSSHRSFVIGHRFGRPDLTRARIRPRVARSCPGLHVSMHAVMALFHPGGTQVTSTLASSIARAALVIWLL